MNKYEIYNVKTSEVVAVVQAQRWVADDGGQFAPGYFLGDINRRVLQLVNFPDLKVRQA